MQSRCLVILSSELQYRALKKTDVNRARLSIICDNPRFFESLQKKNVPFTSMTEFDVRDQWESINVWGCEQALRWIALCRQKGFFKKMDLPAYFYHSFSRILIQMLKNYHFAKKALEDYRPSEVLTFEGIARQSFPGFSGNYYFNYFLKELAQEKNIVVRSIDVVGEKTGEYLPNFYPKYKQLLKVCKKRVKQWVHAFYGFLIRPSKETELLAYGSVRHLGPVLKQLATEKRKLGLYDPEFYLERFLFGLKNKIPYWIPACFPETAKNDREKWLRENKNALLACLKEVALHRLFDYDSRDFSPFVEEQIFADAGRHFRTLSDLFQNHENIFAACSLKAVLVDEDFSPRGGFLAHFAQAKGVQSFCISHANLPLDFSVSRELQVFGPSLTFVNSEYEKDMYLLRGWDPQKFIVTGLPRYDPLLQTNRSGKRQDPTRPFKLLYCATGLWPHSPNQRGYLGCSFMCYAQTQEPAIRTILKAISDFPIELVIKPHSYEAVPVWQQFIQKAQPKNKVTVTQQSYDIFKLYQKCDAMILSYWSTALIETALCGLPTLFVDLNRQHGPTLYDFASRGFCRVVQTEEALRNEIKHLYLLRDRYHQPTTSERELTYYLGGREKGSAARVSEGITHYLNDSTLSKMESSQSSEEVPIRESLVSTPAGKLHE